MTAPHLRAVNPSNLAGPVFKTNTKGEPISSVSNVYAALSGSPEWDGVIKLSDLDGEIKFMKPPPFHETYYSGADHERFPRSITEADLPRLLMWLDHTYNLRVRDSEIGAALLVLAERQRFHPIRDYLGKLTWDGIPRIDEWLVRYLGVTDSEMARKAGAWWLTQAVKRVMEPGCKADYVLILEGPQGARKSTLLERLCPDRDWFMDSHVDLSGGREGPVGMRGKWICEFGELVSMERVSTEQLKAFLSRRVDRYRPFFGKVAVDVARQSAFAGSTNEIQYLRDDTGGRRFWPVRVGQICIDEIERDRDRIWAEAFLRHMDDERAFPTAEEQAAVFGPEQEKRRIEDPLLPIVETWLLENPHKKVVGVTNWDVCKEALGAQPRDLKPGKGGMPFKVAQIMQALGWARNGSSKSYYPATPAGTDRQATKPPEEMS